MIEKFTNLSPETQTIILVVLGLVAALGPLLSLIGTITAALPALTAAFGVLTGPVGLVIGIIGALIAAGVLLYKKLGHYKRKSTRDMDERNKNLFRCDGKHKRKLSDVWNWIKDFAKSFIKGGVIGIIDDYIIKPLFGINLFDIGKNIIRGLIDGIKKHDRSG